MQSCIPSRYQLLSFRVESLELYTAVSKQLFQLHNKKAIRLFDFSSKDLLCSMFVKHQMITSEDGK